MARANSPSNLRIDSLVSAPSAPPEQSLCRDVSILSLVDDSYIIPNQVFPPASPPLRQIRGSVMLVSESQHVAGIAIAIVQLTCNASPWSSCLQELLALESMLSCGRCRTSPNLAKSVSACRCRLCSALSCGGSSALPSRRNATSAAAMTQSYKFHVLPAAVKNGILEFQIPNNHYLSPSIYN